MLISERMNAALNQQIGSEFYASLQYVAVAAHFDTETLPRLAAHFYRQSEEEREHAIRFVKFLVDAGGRVEIPAIPSAPHRFGTAESTLQQALEGETLVTNQIRALVNLAIQEGDHITLQFLQWFVAEQLEELTGMEKLLKIVRRAGESGLLHVEQYLAHQRPPVAQELVTVA